MFFLKRIFVTPTKYIFFMFINYSKYSVKHLPRADHEQDYNIDNWALAFLSSFGIPCQVEHK